MPAYAAPLDHDLSDAELAVAVAHALRDPQLNPGMGHPFNAQAEFFVNCLLGIQAAGPKIAGILAANGGAQKLSARLNEMCWRWAVAGILVPAAGRSLGEYQTTEYGLSFLADLLAEDLVVFIPGELGRVLEERCAGIDDVTLTYAQQSQSCFLSGYYEASVILLGAGAEAALLRLATALNDKRATLGTPELRATVAVRQLAEVATTLRDYRKPIKAALNARGLEVRWIDDLPTLLEGSNAIRLTRNDAGHPQRLLARRSEAQGLLTLFPHLAEALVATTVAIERL